VSDTHDLYKCERCSKDKLARYAEFIANADDCLTRGEFGAFEKELGKNVVRAPRALLRPD
jgi:ribosomal protein L37AE/L43A